MLEMMMLSVRACVHTGSSFMGMVVYAHVNIPPRRGASAPSETPRHPLSPASPAPASAVLSNLRRLTPHLRCPFASLPFVIPALIGDRLEQLSIVSRSDLEEEFCPEHPGSPLRPQSP